MSARLILHPESADFAPQQPDVVLKVLADVGLIGKAFNTDTTESLQRFLIGEHFLQLITFMGCAPAIELQPPADAGNLDFCHVSISAIHPEPVYEIDRVLASPRCPHCRQRIENWEENLEHYEKDSTYCFTCSHCHAELSPQDLNWRKAGGFARIFVSIHGVYPREALPTDHLLNVLQQATAQPWVYFYAR